MTSDLIDPLSVVILTFNEEANLPDCFASLDGLRCVTYVVDSGSVDRTVKIATDHGAEVVHHAFENYATQRNWALAHLRIHTPWVLHLDADERLTPELVDEINRGLPGASPEISGFMLRKRTIFMGKWIRHGGHYPTYHLRLMRCGSGRCEARLYDQHFLVDGAVSRMRYDYLDVVASDLLTWTVRHSRWAALEASQLMASAADGQVVPAWRGNPIQRRRYWRNLYGKCPLFARAFAYWFYRYVVRVGLLDGRQGLIFHFLQGFWFRFLVDALIAERRTVRPAVPVPADVNQVSPTV